MQRFPDSGWSRGKDWGDRFSNIRRRRNDEERLPIKKDFYTEHPSIGDRSEDVDKNYFDQHNISTKGQGVLRPILDFEEVTFPEPIREAMQRENWTEPTPTQAMGWPLALSGRDVIGISRTGSGKTAAFLLPGLIHVMNQPSSRQGQGPIFVCIVPTRELAQQVGGIASRFSQQVKRWTAIVYGGAGKGPQENQLRKGPDLLVGTPGRLLDFLEMGQTDMDRCTYLVLDEADRMLDMGFEPQIRKVIDLIRPDRQTLMYTATWPEEVQDLARDFQTDPVQVNIGSSKLHANCNIEQRIEFCQSTMKVDRLMETLATISQEEQNKTLIFVATKAKADMLERKLRRMRWPANAIHGDKSQTHRDRILQDFRTGRCPVLIATDVASRGLDVQDIQYVINMDFPRVIEDYVHRIGRTARGEKSGVAISFICEEDDKLATDLVNVLQDSKQEVPEHLHSLAFRGGLNKKSQPRYNRYQGHSKNNRYRNREDNWDFRQL